MKMHILNFFSEPGRDSSFPEVHVFVPHCVLFLSVVNSVVNASAVTDCKYAYQKRVSWDVKPLLRPCLVQ